MSDMHGNPHYDEAQSQSVHADTDVSANWATNTGEYKADMLAAAQIEATLALAFEQRTANLIAAFGQLNYDAEEESFLGERLDGYEIAKQIQERLGLA